VVDIEMVRGSKKLVAIASVEFQFRGLTFMRMADNKL